MRKSREGEVTEYIQREKHLELDGRRICYIDEGSGPALLLVHGRGELPLSGLTAPGSFIEEMAPD